MVGRLPDARHAGRIGFARAGDTVALIGPFTPSLAASELAKLRGDGLPDGLPDIDIGAVHAAQFAIRGAVRVGALSSAHDIAEGGLATALAECCLAGGMGADVGLQPAADGDPFVALFGEAPGGFLISGTSSGVSSLGRRTHTRVIGTVGGDALQVTIGDLTLAVTLAELAQAHGALAGLFG
jgi:phosphoribosylformylglycinamidine synthase subunit PurL